MPPHPFVPLPIDFFFNNNIFGILLQICPCLFLIPAVSICHLSLRHTNTQMRHKGREGRQLRWKAYGSAKSHGTAKPGLDRGHRSLVQLIIQGHHVKIEMGSKEKKKGTVEWKTDWVLKKWEQDRSLEDSNDWKKKRKHDWIRNKCKWLWRTSEMEQGRSRSVVN